MRAVGYIRVSSEDQVDSGLSLEDQRTKVEAYAVAMDLELLSIIEDAGRSAKNLNRPGISKALEMIRRKEVEALVILKLDRLTRSVKDLGTLVETFEKTGAVLISVQDSINTATAAGRLVMNVLGSVAQWEREAIGERTKAAMAVKKAKGELVGKIPYGFRLADDKKTLLTDKEEQNLLIKVRELRKSGLSFRKICAVLTSGGLSTKNGGPWQAMTVRGICQR